ncbi:hypothetical protein PWT90_08627 [Aphanocladium album]|nr:hypothetical protein PWT90_08627 [Aphanocladium album]
MSSNPPKTPPQLLQLFNGTPESIEVSNKNIQTAHKALLDKIVAENTIETATFNSILRPILLFEDANNQVKWGNFLYFRVSPNKAIRDASRQANAGSQSYEVDCSMREDIFRLIDAAYASRESQGLDEESLRLLERERRKYVQNGLLLPPGPQRQRFGEITKHISQLCSEAMEHLDESTAGFWTTPEALEGLLGKELDVVDLEKGTGDQEGQVKLTFGGDHYVSLMKFAVKEDTRRDYLIAESNFANANKALFQEIIRLRDETARMIGYPNHAALKIANKMAKTPEAVAAFLDDLIARTKDGAEQDVARMLEYKKKFCEEHSLDFDGKFYFWDRLFYSRMRKNVEFGVDDHEIAQYFPVEGTIEKCSSPTGAAADVVWHPEVQIYAVWDSEEYGGEFCGYLYLDLFPREGKYKQDMTLTIGPGCTKADGTRHYASTTLVCNLTRPSTTQPALLKHHDVETIFHELGHAMDTLSCRTNYERSADLPQDGIEIPSNMLEHWCWDARVLKYFSQHWQTGEAIPNELAAKLARVKQLHATLGLQYSLVRSVFDLQIHNFASHEEAQNVDCGVLCNQIQHDISAMSGPADIGMGMNWGNSHLTYDHLLDGYDAGYYTYYWSQVIGADMFYSMFQADPFSKVQGQRYRRLIIEKGGSRNAEQSLEEFLGRKPNAEAFQRKELLADRAARREAAQSVPRSPPSALQPLPIKLKPHVYACPSHAGSPAPPCTIQSEIMRRDAMEGPRLEAIYQPPQMPACGWREASYKYGLEHLLLKLGLFPGSVISHLLIDSLITMYKFTILSVLLGAAIATPVAELEPAGLDKRCIGQGQFCNTGVPCCANLYCGNNKLCSSCVSQGQFCNTGVPCCNGLYCGNNKLCSSCVSQGQFCNTGVPCCSGLYCGNNKLCSSCVGQGQFCNTGVPCCNGLYCGNNKLCSSCVPRGQFCNTGVPCCAGLFCGTNKLCA